MLHVNKWNVKEYSCDTQNMLRPYHHGKYDRPTSCLKNASNYHSCYSLFQSKMSNFFLDGKNRNIILGGNSSKKVVCVLESSSRTASTSLKGRIGMLALRYYYYGSYTTDWTWRESRKCLQKWCNSVDWFHRQTSKIVVCLAKWNFYLLRLRKLLKKGEFFGKKTV